MAKRIAKIGVGLLIIAGTVVTMAAGTSIISLPQPPPSRAQVAAIVDGDTFDVRFNDQITRVRLGNVAAPTPVSTRTRQPPPCLAPEAAATLSAIIPAGTPLTLSYDRGRFGRTVAQAVTPDGRLVNAEIVRAGLAQVVTGDTDTPVPPPISAAAKDAVDNKRGTHAAGITCTVPGQVKALADLVASVPTGPLSGATVADLAASANKATDARMAAEELDWDLTQNRQDIIWITLDPIERAQLQTLVRTARDQAAAAETALRDATNLAVNLETTETSTQREAAHLAKMLANIRKAEADRAAEAARREAAARRVQLAALTAAQARAETRRSSQSATSQPSRKPDPRSSSSGSSSNDNGNSDTSGSTESAGKKRSSDSSSR